jgi:hypothetical protein
MQTAVLISNPTYQGQALSKVALMRAAMGDLVGANAAIEAIASTRMRDHARYQLAEYQTKSGSLASARQIVPLISDMAARDSILRQIAGLQALRDDVTSASSTALQIQNVLQQSLALEAIAAALAQRRPVAAVTTTPTTRATTIVASAWAVVTGPRGMRDALIRANASTLPVASTSAGVLGRVGVMDRLPSDAGGTPRFGVARPATAVEARRCAAGRGTGPDVLASGWSGRERLRRRGGALREDVGRSGVALEDWDHPGGATARLTRGP